MTIYESSQPLSSDSATSLKEKLLKVLNAPTDEEAKKYVKPLFNELCKSFPFDPALPTPIDKMQKDYWEKSADHLSVALNIIRGNRYYTSWKAEWRKERPFKELCLQPLLLPPISLYLLSGYYLLYLIHGEKIDLFNFDELYSTSLTKFEKNNNKSHRFKTFKERLKEKLGDEIPCMTLKNKYAKQLSHAYEYCREIAETLGSSKTRRSPSIIFNTDGIFEKNGFPELDFLQKNALFFKTAAYTLLSPKQQGKAQKYSQTIDYLIGEAEKISPLNTINDHIASITKKAKRYATNEGKPCIYIYCLLDYKQKSYGYMKFKKYLPLLQNIPIEGRQLYLKSISNLAITPIGWQKSFGSYFAHTLTIEEFQNCNTCTWLQFYESNGELIDAFFPELSPNDKKRLWNIARKAFAYVYPGRFNFDIKEKVPKTPEEGWYEAHNINTEMTIAELIPMMHLIEKLKDINAKDFWFTSYTNRHTTDTFGTMVINIGTHPYQHFITTLHYFWLLIKESLFWGSDIQHIQNLMTEASIRKLSEIWDSL